MTNTTAEQFLEEEYSVGDIVMFENSGAKEIGKITKVEPPEPYSNNIDYEVISSNFGNYKTNGWKQSLITQKYPSIESAPILKYKNPKYYPERKFQVGDRVKVMGYSVPNYRNMGKTGVIEEIGDYVSYPIEVRFSEEETDAFSKEQLELIQPKVEERIMQVNWYVEPEDFKWFGSVGDAIYKQSLTKKCMGVIQNAFKSTLRKAQEKYEIVNGDGGLTPKGREELVDFIFATNEELRDGFNNKILEQYEKDKKEE